MVKFEDFSMPVARFKYDFEEPRHNSCIFITTHECYYKYIEFEDFLIGDDGYMAWVIGVDAYTMINGEEQEIIDIAFKYMSDTIDGFCCRPKEKLFGVHEFK